MRLAESVTFGGSGLDRATARRGDAAWQAEAWARGRILPVWRGKPLCAGEGSLGWVEAGSPVLERCRATVYLGLDGDAPVFAADVSAWEPGAEAEAAQAGFFDPSVQRHPALAPDLGFRELRGIMAALTPREAELAATARALLEWHRTHGFCAACGVATDVTQAGWQRQCPACGASHFPRTDPVVIMLITRGNSVLMGRSPGWPEGMYSLLAGFVEPGETIEAAVRREVAEESGVRVGAVRYLASQPWPFPASLMLGCAGEAETEAIVLDPAELEDAIWLTREEMVSVLAGTHPRLKQPRRGAIAAFLMTNWLADRLD